MRPTAGLPAFWRALGIFNAMHDGIAQHVLKRRQHLVEHLAIELTRGAFHGQFSAFPSLLRDLPHEPGEARDMPLERHHARAHQAILQFCGNAGLLYEQALGLRSDRLQQVLETTEVIGRLRERA